MELNIAAPASSNGDVAIETGNGPSNGWKHDATDEHAAIVTVRRNVQTKCPANELQWRLSSINSFEAIVDEWCELTVRSIQLGQRK